LKIDLEMLEAMVAGGATGAMVLAMVRLECERHEAKRVKRRPVERNSKRRKRGGPKVDIGGHEVDSGRNGADSSARDEATLTDTPRARLFREAKPALLTLGIADSRAGALIVGWLKLTNDDDQLVLATILKAQSLAVAEAPSWILATLKGRTNGNGTSAGGSSSGHQQSGSAAIVAGVAAAAERRGRERSAGGSGRQTPGAADIAREPDFGFGGTPNG
jgi:hypothetical protein